MNQNDIKNRIKYILNPEQQYLLKTIKYLNDNLKINSFPFLRRTEPFCRTDAKTWSAEQRNGTQIRAICLLDKKQVIGAAYLNRSYGKHAHNATLAVTVSPEYQGIGIGTKLCKMLIAEAPLRGIMRLEDEPIILNSPAITMLTNLGFKKEGVMRKKARLDDGSFVDCFYMVLFLD